MRSVSGVLNRTVLATFGLLLVVVSFWLLASGLNAGQAWPEIAPFLASAQDPVASFIGPMVHTPWFLPVVALVSVLIVVVGLLMLERAGVPVTTAEASTVLMVSTTGNTGITARTVPAATRVPRPSSTRWYTSGGVKERAQS